MNIMQTIGQVASTGVHAIQCSSHWVLDGPMRVFNSIKATSDALKLFQKVNDLASAIFKTSVFQETAQAFTPVVDFISARGVIGGMHDLISGKAAKTNPISPKIPNLFGVASKIAFTFGDLTQTVRWLANVHVIGDWVTKSTAQIGTWGKPFGVLRGAGDVAGLSGNILDLCDLARQIRNEFVTEKYFKGGSFKKLTATQHALGVVSDITKIAGTILSNIPGVNVLYSVVSGAVGSTISLGKFFAEQYWKDPKDPSSNTAVQVLVP